MRPYNWEEGGSDPYIVFSTTTIVIAYPKATVGRAGSAFTLELSMSPAQGIKMISLGLPCTGSRIETKNYFASDQLNYLFLIVDGPAYS